MLDSNCISDYILKWITNIIIIVIVIVISATDLSLSSDQVRRVRITQTGSQSSRTAFSTQQRQRVINMSDMICDWLHTWTHNEQPSQLWGWRGSIQRWAQARCQEACWSSALSTWNDCLNRKKGSHIHIKTFTMFVVRISENKTWTHLIYFTTVGGGEGHFTTYSIYTYTTKNYFNVNE